MRETEEESGTMEGLLLHMTAYNKGESEQRESPYMDNLDPRPQYNKYNNLNEMTVASHFL